MKVAPQIVLAQGNLDIARAQRDMLLQEYDSFVRANFDMNRFINELPEDLVSRLNRSDAAASRQFHIISTELFQQKIDEFIQVARQKNLITGIAHKGKEGLVVLLNLQGENIKVKLPYRLLYTDGAEFLPVPSLVTEQEYMETAANIGSGIDSSLITRPVEGLESIRGRALVSSFIDGKSLLDIDPMVAVGLEDEKEIVAQAIKLLQQKSYDPERMADLVETLLTMSRNDKTVLSVGGVTNSLQIENGQATALTDFKPDYVPYRMATEASSMFFQGDHLAEVLYQMMTNGDFLFYEDGDPASAKLRTVKALINSEYLNEVNQDLVFRKELMKSTLALLIDRGVFTKQDLGSSIERLIEANLALDSEAANMLRSNCRSLISAKGLDFLRELQNHFSSSVIDDVFGAGFDFASL